MYYRNQRSFYASRVKGQSGLTPPRIGVTRHTHTHTHTRARFSSAKRNTPAQLSNFPPHPSSIARFVSTRNVENQRIEFRENSFLSSRPRYDTIEKSICRGRIYRFRILKETILINVEEKYV